MTPTSNEENRYHNLGLLGELLSVGHFKVEHMAGVSAALNFIITERTAYESANNPSEENQEAVTEAVSDTDGSQDSSDVSETR